MQKFDSILEKAVMAYTHVTLISVACEEYTLRGVESLGDLVGAELEEIASQKDYDQASKLYQKIKRVFEGKSMLEKSAYLAQTEEVFGHTLTGEILHLAYIGVLQTDIQLTEEVLTGRMGYEAALRAYENIGSDEVSLFADDVAEAYLDLPDYLECLEQLRNDLVTEFKQGKFRFQMNGQLDKAYLS